MNKRFIPYLAEGKHAIGDIQYNYYWLLMDKYTHFAFLVLIATIDSKPFIQPRPAGLYRNLLPDPENCWPDPSLLIITVFATVIKMYAISTIFYVDVIKYQSSLWIFYHYYIFFFHNQSHKLNWAVMFYLLRGRLLLRRLSCSTISNVDAFSATPITFVSFLPIYVTSNLPTDDTP